MVVLVVVGSVDGGVVGGRRSHGTDLLDWS